MLFVGCYLVLLGMASRVNALLQLCGLLYILFCMYYVILPNPSINPLLVIQLLHTQLNQSGLESQRFTMATSTIKSVLVLILLSCIVHGQIAMDIALQYLYLDTNRDNLVSSSEIEGISDKDAGKNIDYFYWRKYETYKYPQFLFKKYDHNSDGKLALPQMNQMVAQKIKRHAGLWPKGSYNLLNSLQTQDYFQICDSDKNKYIEVSQFLVCIQAFIIYEFKNYPHKIKSLLYPNRTIGYSIEQFKTMLPKSDTFNAKKQLDQLFNSFQWPEEKIKEDVDLLIGPEEGKFMEPTMLYFYLDTNWDEVLDRTQALKYFSKFGGDEAFNIADFTRDQKLDQAQLIAYLMFAMCVDDCGTVKHDEQADKCSFSNDEQSMFNRKYQTEQAICHVLQGLVNQAKGKLRPRTDKIQPKQNAQEKPQLMSIEL